MFKVHCSSGFEIYQSENNNKSQNANDGDKNGNETYKDKPNKVW